MVAVGMVLLLGGIISIGVGGWLRRVGQVDPTVCDETSALMPASDNGMPWQPHRHSLTPAEGQVGRHDSFLVWNRRTGEMFRWGRDRDSVAPVRILVPTRYAEVINRRWRDDPWTYCLVLAPHPPFHTRYWGFETSIVVAPPKVEAGGVVAISVFITSERATAVLVDVEMRDAGGMRVARWVWNDQQLPSDERAVYTMRWEVPRDRTPGLHSVKVGLFAPGWGELRHWNDGSAILFVQPPTASVP